ncbi:MAG TPA: ABC transporter substrate-binding protein, partial [Trueperaceae bacterium]
MLVRRRGLQAAAGIAVLALAMSACGGGGSSNNGSSGSSSPASGASTGSAAASTGPSASSSGVGEAGSGVQTNLNDKGTPQTGGTLHMLGTGDVDYMDPNVSYYSIGYLALRIWSRQLVTYPAEPGKVTTDVPDIATEIPTVDNGGISKDGLTYKYTIKDGVKWNTNPPRQVTGADVVRGVKRTCNPAQPFGGLPDYETLIAGFQAFCDGFAKVDPKSAKAIADYQNGHQVEGLSVDPSNPNTVVFKLTQPASYFSAMVSMPAFSPAPAEYDQYIPASAELAQHTISDGPYQIASYNPAHEIKFVRNTAWDPKTDDVRKAYVDAIDINQTGNQ